VEGHVAANIASHIIAQLEMLSCAGSVARRSKITMGYVQACGYNAEQMRNNRVIEREFARLAATYESTSN
jgi:hypothetical protein